MWVLCAGVGLLVAGVASADSTGLRPAPRSSAVCVSSWTGSWGASPSDANSNQPLADQTLRMIIAPHLGGDVLRLHFSNRFGSAPVILGPVTIGIEGRGAALVAGSERAVTFAGHATATIASGDEIVSDQVHLSFGAFADLAISVFVPGSVQAPTEHSITRQTSYLSPSGSGDHTSEQDGSAFTQTTTTIVSNGWYFLDGLDVLAPGDTGSVVAFGDSITDGFQGTASPVTEQMATINTNGRYPDDLARRLIAARVPLSVINAGISGNRLLQDGQIPSFGPSGVSRLGRDALMQPGVSDVIVMEGINDIGQTNGITAQAIIGGYQQLISQTHAAGLRIQLGTLTPAGGTAVPAYGDAAGDQLREQVNQWIRTQSLSDGVVDFDAAVRDPQDPSRISPAYDGSDHLHFNLAGYQALANAIDLSQLTRPACHGAPGPASPAPGPGGTRVRCTSRRIFTVHLPRRDIAGLHSATVTLNGRHLTVLRHRHTSVRVNLTGRPAGIQRLRIVVRRAHRRIVVERRTYHLCVRRRR